LKEDDPAVTMPRNVLQAPLGEKIAIALHQQPLNDRRAPPRAIDGHKRGAGSAVAGPANVFSGVTVSRVSL
jgi:hypothetical protein